ncbi:fimbrial protein [Escherichia coli]|uniref:fimbrial protein n=1 Tax=Escherichia TaxID=561 RepID=UPI000306353C|nr:MULTISPECIES: fimbrial protein [Escherichia]EHQ5528074.1 fimbrial protein [Escherichia coli O2]EGP5934880.1 fimbrial protein [Escherichia coli]EGP5939796.1 fimbrial protein [Escherichia coli]EHK9653564.1 fimbrial protein [Escherichia coli]EHT0616896.1 fimbrial protein [Escherichia coli]
MNYQNITFVLLLCFGYITIGHAASSSMDVTVRAKVIASTCTAELRNAQDQQATTIAIGDVYLNELSAKSKYQNFSLVFSNCEGLAKDQAKVVLSAQTGCDGASSSGGGYRNELTTADDDAATGVAVEVWTTNQPEGQGSIQLNCKTKPTSIVDLTAATGSNIVHWPLSARIVIASDNTIADVRAGQFSTNAIFFVTYE